MTEEGTTVDAGVTFYQEPGFTGPSRRLDDTGLDAYAVAALGLDRVGSVRIRAVAAPDGSPQRVFRAQLFDRAPVYLPTGEAARARRITADLSDTGDWAARTRYVTVASCRPADADWGFARVLAAGEPARYSLVEERPGRLDRSGRPERSRRSGPFANPLGGKAFANPLGGKA